MALMNEATGTGRRRASTGTWVVLGLGVVVAALLLGRAWGESSQRADDAPVTIHGSVVSLDPDGSVGCIEPLGKDGVDQVCGPIHPARGLDVRVGATVDGYELAGIAADGTDVRLVAVTAVEK
ncbi:hypothetical protein [Cellulomonas sp. URHD0024]|uniref:hypothetical protein n=1 Tax=Cellulomonas sp. URHD0024 TaxID=1302620 RepID=UPI000481BF4F|nr:hypothetical protein [Cellulomonas sp. URHD0024]